MNLCKVLCILLVLLFMALFLRIAIYFNSTTTIYKPIPGTIILKSLIKNVSYLKVLPLPFNVHLCFLISSSLCLCDHKEEALALPWAEITHSNSTAESSYPIDSRFIKQTHFRLIYYAVVAAAGHKKINHRLTLHLLSEQRSVKPPFPQFLTFLDSCPDIKTWDRSGR